jgi:hypothetical protein
MRNKIMQDIGKILDTIPSDTGLFEDEVKLELATKILELISLPDQSLDEHRDTLIGQMAEFGMCYGSFTHPEDHFASRDR